MAAKYEVGQRVWLHRPKARGLDEKTGWGTVATVDHKYFTLEPAPGFGAFAGRFHLEGGCDDDPNWPVYVYASQEAQEAHTAAGKRRTEIRDWAVRRGWGELSDEDTNRVHALLVEIGVITTEDGD
jgi:hypothetical protein